jgi:hypothetical protein
LIFARITTVIALTFAQIATVIALPFAQIEEFLPWKTLKIF